MRQAIIAVLLLALFAVPAAAKPYAVETKDTTFNSSGKKIRLEMYLPQGQKECPAIVLVHDSAGLGLIPGTIFRQCSQTLAREGYAVLLVHYFNSTGHRALKPEQVRKSKKHWPVWKNTVRDAIKLAIDHPRIDGKRIGLLGFSLGAYLSLAVASDKDMKITAVAEYFGGLPEMFWKQPQQLRLPPTLIIHGVKDQIVPAKEAYALRGLFSVLKVPCELKLYNCGHLFLGTQLRWKKGNPGNLLDIDGDIADARDRTIRFFGRYLMSELKAKQKRSSNKGKRKR